MAHQSLLWTTLPNGLTDDRSGLRLSVMVSPRLQLGTEDRPVLSTFPDWEDWPATLARATFEITYGGAAVTIRAIDKAGPNRIDATVGAADSSVWRALFTPTMPVKGHVFEDMSATQVLSYDTVAVAELVESLYGRLAAATTGDLPTASDLLDDPDWAEVVAAVVGNDDRSFDPHTGLRDPGRQFAVARDENFDSDPQKSEPPSLAIRVATKASLLRRLQLFHTPPSQPVVATRPQQNDPRIVTTSLTYAQTPLPAKEDLAKELDFHQIVAAMNPYPTVLRRLGIVIDLVVDRASFPDVPEAPLSVAVTFADPALDPPGSNPIGANASPITHARLQGTSFVAVSNPVLLPVLLTDDFRVPDRLLDVDRNKFRLLEVDVDGAGLKVMNFARSLARLQPDDERVDAVTRFEREVGAPALRTAGLMLVHRRRANALRGRFAANRTKNDAAKKVFGNSSNPSPILWAEDLVRGFRFDIWDSSTGVWRSLCRRQAIYEVGPGITVMPESGEEEGTARLATTKAMDPLSNPGLLWLHEAVVSWTGWSLAAALPGRAIHPDDSVNTGETRTDAELPPGISFRSRFSVVSGSLPRLRFGRKYWIRGRAVDLAGNSLAFQEKDFGPENPDAFAQPFLRYEPVAAPVIALVKRLDGFTELTGDGESMQHLAIRSFNDTRPDNEVPSAEQARRFAVPPQVSVKEAEHHGMLDAGGKVDSTTFDLLANQKDFSADNPAASLIEERIATKGPLDTVPVDTVFAVYRDGRALTYLPDPLAHEVAARLFKYPEGAEIARLVVPLYRAKGWPEAQPFKIELREAPTLGMTFSVNSRTLHVTLPKGERATIRLSIRLSREALRETMGVWRWVAAPTPAQEALALEGQNWLLTPWRTIEVVHAVQRPLLDPEFARLAIDRAPGSTSARVRFVARCSIKSTDRVDVRGDWHEPSDDPIRGNVDLARGDTAYHVKITHPSSFASRHLGFERGGIPDHTIPGDDLIAVGPENNDFVPPKAHEFHDTRYRRISYWLEGTTRFREYLPARLLTTPGPRPADPPVPTEDNVKVVGPPQVAWVPSSAPPPAPEVLYVVPTFGWERSHQAAGNASSWRRGGGLRVYLNRPWNASGYGEMLGVVLPPASFVGDPDTKPSGNPYRRLVTQWGNDPIWESPFVPGLAPGRSNFPLSRTKADTTGAWLPSGAPRTEGDQPAGPFRVTGLGPFGAPVEVAPHDVFYDDARQLWYCDIVIDQGAAYWPMVRLALARYQPVSVDGAHLSEVVLADFMPLVSDRWLNVKRTGQGNTRSVTVFGLTYEDSAGNQEASRAVSFINPLTHEVTESNLEVSARTVVELTVERLDPSHGEDFGWEPVDANIRQAGATTTDLVSAATRFIPSSEIARAKTLHAEGSHRELLEQELMGAIFAFNTLWDGSVTLPEDPSPENRFRLVIAEYEEYVVDDDHPYGRVPTKKDRRLVFVEHIEL